MHLIQRSKVACQPPHPKPSPDLAQFTLLDATVPEYRQSPSYTTTSCAQAGSVAVQAARAVRARGEQPGLRGVPRAVRHSLVIRDGVTPQHLERHQERVGHKIRVHHAVEHVRSAVVSGRRKQRVGAVERSAAQRGAVVPQRLVRLVRQVQVVPGEPLVVRAHKHVVPAGVHRQAGRLPAAAHQLLGQRLLGQVVHAHVVARRHEEEGLGGVEQHARDTPLVLPERRLAHALGQLVHQHRLRVACRRH
mmetsp:Transcript_28549/g.72641  ORF Transcript_28549/g.72641 Transcript_28549/m.72641 type:complete len:248 (-) Transcript_28549:1756-2499(-)